MAINSMRRAYARDEVRELIEAREKAERDEISRMHKARLDALAEGRQEGQLEGAREATRLLARRLLESGMEAERVLELTGLSENELQ